VLHTSPFSIVSTKHSNNVWGSFLSFFSLSLFLSFFYLSFFFTSMFLSPFSLCVSLSSSLLTFFLHYFPNFTYLYLPHIQYFLLFCSFLSKLLFPTFLSSLNTNKSFFVRCICTLMTFGRERENEFSPDDNNNNNNNNNKR
jgi:hypothetical protein